MEPDYPAAHSMDTTWYAVDAQGHVGVFVSGENGPIPAGARDQDYSEVFTALRGKRDYDPDSDWCELEEGSRRHGFFVYGYQEDYSVVAPYTRVIQPEAPLHVDELPPHLREEFKRVRLDRVTFLTHPLVQPVEHLECRFWWDGESAYLDTDGKTLKPVPGKEERFRRFVAEMRRRSPEEASGYRVEGEE